MVSAQTPVSIELFALPTDAVRTGSGWLTYPAVFERSRATQFSNGADALGYLATRALMRTLAAGALGLEPGKAPEIPVDRTCLLCDSPDPHGKPRIRGVNFSMSRSRGMVAGALCLDASSWQGSPRLGADIEGIRDTLFSGFDRLTLTPDEAAAVARLPDTRRQFARLMLWTAKEAVLKATGHGLTAGPQAVEISLPRFPDTPRQVAGFSCRGQLTLGSSPPQNFWLRWQIVDRFLLATALDTPYRLTLHPVRTPTEVREIIDTREPPTL